MRKTTRLILLAALCVLLTALLSVAVFADGITSELSYENHVLTVTCNGVKLTAQPEWEDYDATIDTIWIRGDFSTIDTSAFASLAEKCTIRAVVLDTSYGSGSTKNNLLNKFTSLKWLYYVERMGFNVNNFNLATAVSSTVKKIAVEDTEQLCRITLQGDGGTLISDAGVYAMKDDVITVSYLPSANYVMESLSFSGVTAVEGAENRFRVDDDAVFTGNFITRETIAIGAVGNIGWALYEDGELRITGIGAIADAGTAEKYPWYSYRGAITELYIESSVTGIPKYAFSGCANLFQITGWSGITSIGQYAFNSCASLESVTIPDGVTAIANNTFQNCAALTSVTLPDNVTSIGNCAFQKCTSLPTVTIPESVSSIGDKAFDGCTELHSAEFLGNAPTTLGADVFPYGNTGDFIAYWHKDNKGFGEIKGIVDGVISKLAGTYYTVCLEAPSVEDCETLYFVEQNGNTVIAINNQGILFSLDTNRKTAAVGVDSDGTYQANNAGYYGLPGQILTADKEGKPELWRADFGIVTIPNTVVYDGQNYKVESISPSAFQNNRALKEIVLNSGLKEVRDGAFYGCNFFTDFYVADAEGKLQAETDDYGKTTYVSESFASQDGILYSKSMTELYVVPCGKEMVSYELIPKLSNIANCAFRDCRGIQEVVIHNGVLNIGDYVFKDATGLRSLSIENDVLRIGTHLCDGCVNLESLYIYGGVQSFGNGDSMLYNCRSLANLTVPFLGTGTDKGGVLKDLFYNQSLKKGDVPESLTSVTVLGGKLNTGAFQNCTRLSAVRLGRSITTLPEKCFNHCESLRYVDLGLNENDRYGKFQNAAADGVVRIRKHITSIGEYAFRACAQIARFTVDSDNRNYDSDFLGALYTEGYGTLLTYPSASKYQYYCVKRNAIEVKPFAFYYCKNLVSINVPGDSTTFLKKADQTEKEGNGAIYPDSYVNPELQRIKVVAHDNSAAETSLGLTTITHVDYHSPVNLVIEHMPDRLAFTAGNTPAFENLYFKVTFDGNLVVLLDDQDTTMTYSGLTAGLQTVTAKYKTKVASKSTTFQIYLFAPQEDYAILEYALKDGIVQGDDPITFIGALYDDEGRLLTTAAGGMIWNAANNDLRCALYYPNNLLDGDAHKLKIFPLSQEWQPLDKPIAETWLSTPVWGEVHSPLVNRVGEISWMRASGESASYNLNLYRKQDDGDSLVGSWWYSWWNGSEWYDSEAFLDVVDGCGSGTYYFTVTIEGSAESHQASATVRSEDFVYTRPEGRLQNCTDLKATVKASHWSAPEVKLSWTLPEDTSHYGGYKITLHFNRYDPENEESWRTVGSQTFYFDTGACALTDNESFANLETLFAQNSYRAGYYAFTVTALPDDISAANCSKMSARSEPIYYIGQ